MHASTEQVAAALKAIRERMGRAAARVGRDPAEVTLVVVTKSAPPEVFELLAGLGVADVAENRAQAARSRLPPHRDRFRIHFIGHLQSNKARKVLPLCDVFHGIDSGALLQRLDQLAVELGLLPEVLLQVNISGEASKSGLTPDELPAVVAMPLRAARLVGLMTMAPAVEDPEAVRGVFRALRGLRDELVSKGGPPLPQLSMGMSHDFEVAIEEGATLIRVGRAIVGPLGAAPPAAETGDAVH